MCDDETLPKGNILNKMEGPMSKKIKKPPKRQTTSGTSSF